MRPPALQRPAFRLGDPDQRQYDLGTAEVLLNRRRVVVNQQGMGCAVTASAP